MRHPSENFIKYLMTSGHQAAPDNEWVRMMVTALNYPSPDTTYLNWLRNDINSKIPADFRPNDRFHTDSRKFLRSEGIFGFHQQTREVKEANDIVLNYRARSLTESLLLGRIEARDVAKKVNTRLGTFYTEEGVDAYRHYYWQVGIMRVEDWMVLLPNPTDDLQKQNIVAISQVGASMALHKTGIQQQIDSKSMLRSMQESLYFDFMEWRTKKHGSERTKSLTGIAKAAVMVDEQLSQSDSALKDSLKAFEQFRMETERIAIPDVRALAPEGNFSKSGAKLIEAKCEEKDDESS